MGASAGGPEEGSVNVELNLVPFIDLMSCLTAFLLMTAAWTQHTQLMNEAKAQGRNKEKQDDTEQKVEISILLTPEDSWVTLTRVNSQQRFAKKGDAFDWTGLRRVLSEAKQEHFSDRSNLNLAAETGVPYQEMIIAMETAFQEGFNDISVTTPQQLPLRPVN